VRLLALSGSLRSVSINSAFCRTLMRLAPPAVCVSVHEGLGDLPLFNPDLESAPPAVVTAFRGAVSAADGILIASPEYAHGVSGVMKNALDWLVSFEGAVGKRVALVNTSPRAHHAYDSLAEVLRTMSMDIVPDASLAIPLLGYLRTTDEMSASPEVRVAVHKICEALTAESR
jgi:chromate reductase, NAD(P)H dehydrogenase (quinone)